MKVAISVVRPFHVAQMANALRKHVDAVSIYSSAPRKSFRRLGENVSVHMVPAPIEIIDSVLPFRLPQSWFLRQITYWDRLVGALIPRCDAVIGFATQSLATAHAAHRKGARFILDRACPFVDFQQQLVREETEVVGGVFKAESSWFHERQLAEYEVADSILTPSRYTASSFPPHLQSKVVIAPLLGRASVPEQFKLTRNTPFTVGVLGGNPLRKGYIYLLEAWKKLALPQAKLLIRSSSDLSIYPRLQELLSELPNVEIISYVPNIAEFYQRCDLFVLPSVDDGFGMALFEAMGNGVPSIATRNCGASELLTDGIDGLIVEARSAEQLAAAMLRLYENEELRQSIAVAARATVLRIAQSSLYEDALTRSLLVPAPAAAPMAMARG